jgi:FHA domain-containing protein
VGVLQRFERRIENLVNRPFAKAFRAEVQPVEVASALQRECDNRAAIVAKGRTMVPNAFVVELGEHDHDRLAPYEEPLGAELGDMVAEHAADQGYSFIGPVSVRFERHDDLDTGIFRVRSSAEAGGLPSPQAPRFQAYVQVKGQRVALTSNVTVVGRGTDADLRIDDPGVSRRHAEILIDDEKATVVDTGSTNGVYVDDNRVAHAELRDGSRVTFGSTTVVFHYGEAT